MKQDELKQALDDFAQGKMRVGIKRQVALDRATLQEVQSAIMDAEITQEDKVEQPTEFSKGFCEGLKAAWHIVKDLMGCTCIDNDKSRLCLVHFPK